jgi:hypothetical protein
MDKMKSLVMNGCWKKLWPNRVNDFEESPTSWPKQAHKVPGERLPHLEQADVQEVLKAHVGELHEEDLVNS